MTIERQEFIQLSLGTSSYEKPNIVIFKRDHNNESPIPEWLKKARQAYNAFLIGEDCLGTTLLYGNTHQLSGTQVVFEYPNNKTERLSTFYMTAARMRTITGNKEYSFLSIDLRTMMDDSKLFFVGLIEKFFKDGFSGEVTNEFLIIHAKPNEAQGYIDRFSDNILVRRGHSSDQSVTLIFKRNLSDDSNHLRVIESPENVEATFDKTKPDLDSLPLYEEENEPIDSNISPEDVKTKSSSLSAKEKFLYALIVAGIVAAIITSVILVKKD